jgi:hypothetical protein
MGKGIWIGATIVSVIAMVLVLFLMGFVQVPNIPGLPGLPKCTLEKVYYTQEFVDQYNLDPDQSMETCVCSGTSEWVPEVTGSYCIPIDGTRPDCIPGQPQLDLLTCNCRAPNVWIGGDDDMFKCDEW